MDREVVLRFLRACGTTTGWLFAQSSWILKTGHCFANIQLVSVLEFTAANV